MLMALWFSAMLSAFSPGANMFVQTWSQAIERSINPFAVGTAAPIALQNGSLRAR